MKKSWLQVGTAFWGENIKAESAFSTLFIIKKPGDSKSTQAFLVYMLVEFMLF
jgi:hypothetical protein